MSGANGNGNGSSGALGSCCETLNEVVNNEEFTPTFFVEEDGVMYATVGFVVLEDDEGEEQPEDHRSDDDIGWFDHAVFFCPFCGSKLQTPEEVEKKVGAV